MLRLSPYCQLKLVAVLLLVNCSRSGSHEKVDSIQPASFAQPLTLSMPSFHGKPWTLSELQPLWQQPEQATQALVNHLSNREKLGQLFMLDLRLWSDSPAEKPQPVTVLPSSLASVINRYAIGSLIVFRENCLDTKQVYRLNQQLQASRFRLPLLIALDQEGGTVQRLPMATQLPGNMALGATRDLKLAAAAGEITGKELRALGFNVNFAPVVDVNVNQKNPVIGVRSFSSDPQMVAEMAQAYIGGLQKTGVLAVAKHFPGHGNTSVDSHSALPIIPYTREEWLAIDHLPFQQAIKSGVAALMSAHVAAPALDPTTVLSKSGAAIPLPATLSPVIIQKLLRQDLYHSGLIFSDALCMRAITDHFETTEVVERVLLAGIDIAVMPLLVRNPTDVTALEQLYVTLEKRMVSDPILKQRVDEALQRIIFSKLHRRVSPQSSSIEQAFSVVGCPDHKKVTKAMARRAVTVVENRGVLPIDCRQRPKLLLLSQSVDHNKTAQRIVECLSQKLISLQTAVINWTDNRLPTELSTALAKTEIVILMLHDLVAPSPMLKKIVDRAYQAKKRIVVLATTSPYSIAYVERQKVDAMMVIYGSRRFDKTDPGSVNQISLNLKAAMETLLTDSKRPALFNRPMGRLPVTVIAAVDGAGCYALGHGLRYR
ncbi:MAG: glycoside hydrolase family 3 protein [Candidatus Symbiodolus clandestinus]